jgi:hypothetical protein
VKLFEALRLSKTKRALLDKDAPDTLVRPAIAVASESGIEFLSLDNKVQKMIWSVARLHPEAAVLVRSESWEPIDPLTGLEVLAAVR